MTEKKIELKRTAKASLAKLPQLKITPFKGTAADWVKTSNKTAWERLKKEYGQI